MGKILQIKTCGMKNLAEEITIDFANLTIEKGVSKINNVKGIFGYNGSGKTALMTSIDYYIKIVTDPKFLLQNETIKKLDRLLNYQTRCFKFSIVFEYHKDIVLKHMISLVKNALGGSYIINNEEISLSSGRTLNDTFKPLVRKDEDGSIFILPDERVVKDGLAFLATADLAYSSVVMKVIERVIESNKKKEANYEYTLGEKILTTLFFNIKNMDVYLSDSDSHNNFLIDKETLEELLSSLETLKQKKDSWVDLYSTETIIPIDRYDSYSKENKKLEKFIKVFKPELNEIEIKKSEDKNTYHVRRLFKYKKYNVEYEFESSGIKQLVKLFTYLSKCANGGIVFVDEIDVNINAVYFEKLISFFKNYGNGQLIFTTHNIEAMNALKGQSRSILVLGEDNKIDVWVGKGNKSPVSDYIGGFFPHSPMNVEDFDFVNIFLEED